MIFENVVVVFLIFKRKRKKEAILNKTKKKQ